MTAPTDIAWELRGIRKTFGPVVANDDVSLVLRRGQIHGLVGENGSGKSTLIKTLCGAHRPDAGMILHLGKRVVLHDTLAARSLGIATVFQEFSLVPDMTVAENISLGRWPGGALKVDWPAIRQHAQEILDSLGINIPLDARIRDLPVSGQQLAEIAKAIAGNADVVVLDEPTTALGVTEIEHLHNLLRRMRDAGAAILYVSHRIDQIVELCDVVTVMRNGHIVSTAEQTPLDVTAIIGLMIGKEITEQYPKADNRTVEVLLDVRALNTERIKDVTFTLHRGEVLGLGGTLGSGRSAIARALFGVDPVTGGEIVLKGNVTTIRNPAEAINAGLALLTENRNVDGLFFNFNGTQNITAASLPSLDHVLWLDLHRERILSHDLVQRLQIAAQAEFELVDRLSGGNQQKVIVARWLNTGAEVFILDEPTKGIDVGTKVAIYQLINELTAAGKGVILISSDDKELLAMSDRVAIVRRGRITRIADAHDVTKADLLMGPEKELEAA